MIDAKKEVKRYLLLENADALYCVAYMRNQIKQMNDPEWREMCREDLESTANHYDKLFAEFEETGVYEPERSYFDAVIEVAGHFLKPEQFSRMRNALRQDRRRRFGKGSTITISKKAHRMLSQLAQHENITLSAYLEKALETRYKNLLKSEIEGY